MTDDKRTYNRDEPVALDDRDPSNSDISNLLAPLDPDDDVFTLVNPHQGDLREITPVGADTADTDTGHPATHE